MKPSIKTLLLASALIAYLTAFYSCSNSTNNNTPIIDVKSVIGKGAIHNTSEFIKDIKYVPLETGPNSMVGSIVKVVVESNRIYISDNQGKINIFDTDGRYLNTLNKKGRGPQEYLRVTDYTVDPAGSIFILSELDGIVEYNSNLEFVEKTSFNSDSNNIYYWDILLLKKGLFVSNVYDLRSFDTGYKQALTIYNDSLEVRVSYSTELISNNPASIRRMPYEYYIYNGDLVIYRMVSDTISSIDIDNNYLKSVKYILNYGGYALTEEIMRTEDIYIDANHISLNKLMETDNYLFMSLDFMNLAPEPFYKKDVSSIFYREDSKSIFDRNSYVNAIYNKKSDKFVLLNQPYTGALGLKDDIIGGAPFWPRIITQKQELVTWHNTFELISLAEEGKIDKSLVANLKEGDNPIIVIATPK